jgi:hypothetical protein
MSDSEPLSRGYIETIIDEGPRDAEDIIDLAQDCLRYMNELAEEKRYHQAFVEHHEATMQAMERLRGERDRCMAALDEIEDLASSGRATLMPKITEIAGAALAGNKEVRDVDRSV